MWLHISGMCCVSYVKIHCVEVKHGECTQTTSKQHTICILRPFLPATACMVWASTKCLHCLSIWCLLLPVTPCMVLAFCRQTTWVCDLLIVQPFNWHKWLAHKASSALLCFHVSATSMSWEDSIHVLQLPEYMGWDSYSYILTLLQYCSNCDHCILSSAFVVACNNQFMIQQGSLYFSHIRTYMLLEAPACVTMLPYSYVLLHSEALCITSQ